MYPPNHLNLQHSSIAKYLCAQLLSRVCNPVSYSPLGSSVHGIFQARILEWVFMPSSRGSSWPRDRTCVSCIAGRFFPSWVMGKTHSWIFGELKNFFRLSYFQKFWFKQSEMGPRHRHFKKKNARGGFKWAVGNKDLWFHSTLSFSAWENRGPLTSSVTVG